MAPSAPEEVDVRVLNKVAATGGLAAAGLAAAVLGASPAFAVNGLLLPTVGSGSNGPHHVNASCTPTVGVATNLNQISYALEATATSYSTNGSVPIGTSVQCFAYRVSNNHIYGSIAGGEPGPAAAAAGVVAVPTTVESALCVKAHGLFNDNGTASKSNCPF
jgi:hypothetical protein